MVCANKTNQVKCWVSSFNDNELLDQVEGIVSSTIEEMQEFITKVSNSQNIN